MSVYVVAQISIHDRAVYDRYQARFMSVFKKYRGELLAADETAEAVEGEWTPAKIILMRFPDRAAFEEWAFSDEYREIAKDRHAGSNGVVLLVKGFN